MRWALLGIGLLVIFAALGSLARSLQPDFDPDMRSVALVACAVFIVAGLGWIGLFFLFEGWAPHYDPRGGLIG